MNHADAVALRRVIVTRPEADAGSWVRQLQKNGFAAELLPLIEIVAATGAADVHALAQAWHCIDSYAACMFVSGNAVRFFFEPKPEPAQHLLGLNAIDNIANTGLKSLPPNLRFMAPGPGTSAALLAAGVPAGQIDAPPLDAEQFDSEALWKVIGQRDWHNRRVLVVRGVTAQAGQVGQHSRDGQVGQPDANDEMPPTSYGRDWITRQWQAAGADVDFVGVYERRAPVWTPAQVQCARAASADGAVWLFSSSEAVLHLSQLPGLEDVDWGRAVAIATHPRISATVRGAGWGVVRESRPALADILVTLRSIESDDS